MTGIFVTQAAVRKLAASLSKIDTSKVSHGDRLDLIASAFGWKTDALMPALKTQKKEPQSGAAPDGPLALDETRWGGAYPLRKLGIRLCCSWELAAEQSHGVLIVSGVTGSGRMTTLASTALHLAHQGRRVIDVTEDSAVKSGKRGDVVLFGSIHDSERARLAYDLADRGMLVLAYMACAPFDNFKDLLAPSVSGRRLELTRAVLHQHLVRKLRPSGTQAADGLRYQGRAMVSYLHEFGVEQTVPQFLAEPDAGVRHFLPDLIEKLEEGVTDIDEVERCFGPYVVGCIMRTVP